MEVKLEKIYCHLSLCSCCQDLKQKVEEAKRRIVAAKETQEELLKEKMDLQIKLQIVEAEKNLQ